MALLYPLLQIFGEKFRHAISVCQISAQSDGKKWWKWPKLSEGKVPSPEPPKNFISAKIFRKKNLKFKIYENNKIGRKKLYDKFSFALFCYSCVYLIFVTCCCDWQCSVSHKSHERRKQEAHHLVRPSEMLRDSTWKSLRTYCGQPRNCRAFLYSMNGLALAI